MHAQSLVTIGNRKVDSLRMLLETVKEDTSKISILNNLSQQFIDNNEFPSADSAARVALRMADEWGFKKYKGDSYNKIGNVYISCNKNDTARIYFIKALEEDKRVYNKYNYIKHLGNIGLTYLLQTNFEKARSCYMSALHMAELFHVTSTLPFCYNNIGNLLLQEQRYHEAFQYFSKSLSANKDLHDKNSFFVSLRNIAVVYNIQGNYSKSLSYQTQALSIAKSIGNRFKMEVCYMTLGDVYKNLGDIPAALNNYFQALKLTEEIDNKKELADALLGIGGCYYDGNDHEKGISYLLKGYNKMKESGDQAGIARTVGNMGLIYHDKKEYNRAIFYYLQYLSLSKELGVKTFSVSWLTNLAWVYRDKSLVTANKDSAHFFREEALRYFIQARDQSEQYGKTNDLVQSLHMLGCFYYEEKKVTEAINYLNRSLELSYQTGEITHREQIHKMLSTIYNQQKNLGLELKHYKQYIVLRDSINSLQGAEKKVRSEINYEYERKQAVEKEKQKQQALITLAEKKRQRTILGSVTSSMLLTMLAACFMYRSYLQKKRINRELENKNQKIRHANKIIKEKNHAITDSINYALHIQEAMLPDKKQIETLLPESFILFKPKDIVSGDFYFFIVDQDIVYLAAVDCTGHGVPGGFMSMIGSEKLNTAVKQSSDPGKILSLVNAGIILSLHQSEHDFTNRDGMDIALCAIDLKNSMVEFSGANRPMWVIRKNSDTLEELIGTKSSIGGITSPDKSFEKNAIQLQQGDTFYIFSDGYADQFGVTDKKMTTRRFKNYLLSIKNFSMPEQERLLHTFLTNWKGETTQTDDILVIGVRL